MPTTTNINPQAAENDQPTVFALLESLPDSAFIINPDGRILAGNSRFASHFGKAADACAGQNLYLLIAEDFRFSWLGGTLEKECAAVLQSGQHLVFDDGAWTVSLNPVRSSSGAIDSLFVQLQDSSRQSKTIDVGLSVDEERLSQALPGTGIGIWAWELKTGNLNWFGDLCPIFGLEKNHLSHSLDQFKVLLLPDDREEFSRAIAASLSTGGALSIEFRLGQPGGPIRWIAMSGKPVYGASGDSPERYVGSVIDMTERKLIEEELTRSKAMIEQVMRVSRAGFWEKNLRSGELFWSDTMWSLFGLDKRKETLTYDLWKRVLHPEDLDKTVESSAQSISAGVEMNIEYRICHADGSVLWFMSRGMPIRNDAGDFERYIGTVIDITERKLLEQELVESKIRYDYALDAAHAGIWEWNAQTDELRWSEQVWKLYGLSPGSRTLNHQLCVDTVYTEDRQMVSQLVREGAEKLEAVVAEYRATHPDGSVHWLTSRGMPVFDAKGALVRYIGAIIESTERKQIELDLVESRNRLGFALEAARAGVWEWNLQTDENIWSEEMWLLHGLPRSEGHQASFGLWADAIHPDDRDMAVWVVSTAARQQRELNVEYRTIHEDGSIHWLMSRGKPRQDERGKTMGYIGTVIDMTEQKTAEIQLRESKFRFNFALEATGAGIWEWDVKTDRLFWSDQIWALYGLEPQGNISSHKLCGTTVHPEDRELTLQTMNSATQRMVDFTVEYRVSHPDGSVHWLMCRGVPLQSSGRQPGGSYLGMIMDITDRKRSEEERRKSRKQLNLVIEKGNIGIWTIDLKNFSAQRTVQYARIFGYDSIEKEWSLDAFLEHVVPEERDAIRETIRKYCKNHKDHTFECKIRTADNRLRWIWVFGAFNYDRAQRIYYLSGIVQDITDRKQAELLLKESEQKFRNIFEFSPVAIGIGDFKDGELFDVNASWLRLFGFSKKEAVGQNYGDLGLYLDAEEYESIMYQLRKQGRVSNRQLRLKTRAAKIVTILFSAESITIAGQRNVLFMLTDITLQELQQASINQLEQAVADRTEQLQEEVERLNRFLSMISHEYRTPLAIIRGNLDLIDLKSKSGNHSTQREMHKIKQAIERLVGVMEVSIQESRLQESSEEFNVTNFQIEPVILLQIEAFRSMWPERTIHYSGDLDGSEIIGAQGQFGMAIFNLLDNARKYSPPDSPIALESRAEHGEAIITIRNEGKSISSAECDELFEKYRRGSNAANTGGAGIGLWLVKDIIEHHHGAVSLFGIESGVEAVVTVPLVGQQRLH